MKDLSIYVHIPFCKSRCAYCGFTTFAGKDSLIDRYITALLREITEKAPLYKDREIVSVYFGGGTPSHIPHTHICGIIETISENFNILPGAEITLEANPESVNDEKIAAYKKAGINRLSTGIQSLENKTLKKIGRAHDVETALSAIKTAKKNFNSYSLDFIIGLPFQTVTSFTAQLETVLAFDPPHLSFYFLSPDSKNISTFIKDCPGEDEQIKMYELLTVDLKKAGYIHYEVSNYGKPGYESRHNLRYWEQKEYLGLGLAAHSYIEDTIYENTPDLKKYLGDHPAPDGKLILDSDLKRMDYIMTRLRTAQGIDINDYCRKFGTTDNLIEKAAPYIESGLMLKTTAQDKTGLILTEKGFLLLDRIIDDLI